jgi:hypothetical protein
MHRICNKTLISEMIDCTETMERSLLEQPSPHHPQTIKLPFPFSCLAVPLTGMFVLITSGCHIPERAGTEYSSKQEETYIPRGSVPPLQ